MDKNTSLQKIYKNPKTKAIQSLIEDNIPLVGSLLAAGRAAFEQKLSNIQEERTAIFLDELDKGGSITTEMLEKEPFIHSLLVVYRAAINTYHREKIRRFARILLTAIEENELASDKFQEFTNIADDLSERELEILTILNNCQLQYPHELRQSRDIHGEITNEYTEDDFQRANRFWPTFVKTIENSLGHSPSMLESLLVRLNRTGLYETFIGTYLGYSGGIGKTTTLFEEFIKWIKLEPENSYSLSDKET